MLFSRLRLNGFKSFVDPTDLIISDGLTGVVGPNGCGKSNLLEALRWVMGENRPTAMRGGGMEDVIFAGAATRPARNFAEVALQIDNKDRLAPEGFNEDDNLEIVRRVTRDIGSAYKVNTRDVRARDVQMLFADASTGAHSPALVRQGQISELISAKPTARRRILEEAAGIAGLYQRRHEAELKLKAADANLRRIDDVLEQLSAQLQSLARQARQARRYREVADALRTAEGVLLYGRWKHADKAHLEAQSVVRERTTETAKAEAAARSAGTERQAAEAQLPSLRDAEAVAAAILQRLQVARDALVDEEARAKQTISTLRARIEQLSADITRETTLNGDAQESVERLTQERDALIAQAEGFEERVSAAAAEAKAAAEVLQERENALSVLTEDVARLAARHQSATRLLEDSRLARERSQKMAQETKAALEAAKATLGDIEGAFGTAQEAEAAAKRAIDLAESTLSAAEARRGETQEKEILARSARSEVLGNLTALRAEVDSLERLIGRERGDANKMIDQLSVDPGFEKAIGAALAEDLKQPMAKTDKSGWISLQDYPDTTELPGDARPITAHVTAPPALRRRLAHVGIVTAEDGSRLHARLSPGQRLVSMEGDLWRWDGLRFLASDMPSSTALRLENHNRLAALRDDLKAAEEASQKVIQEHEALNAQLQVDTADEQQARVARREAEQALTDAARALSKAESEKNLAAGRIETLELAQTRHGDEETAAREAVTAAEALFEELADIDDMRARVEEHKINVEAARLSMIQRRSAYDEMRREGVANRQRQEAIDKESATWGERLKNAQSRIEELGQRREAAQAELAEAAATPDKLAQDALRLGEKIDEATAAKTAAIDALALGEGALRKATTGERDAERHASDMREGRARAEARFDSAKEALEAALQRITDEHGASPQELLEQLALDPASLPNLDQGEAEVNRLLRQRDSLGAVNLRAEEDSAEIQSEYDTLSAEKNDVEEALQSLRSGIAGLNRDGRQKLLDAFNQVNRNFGVLFKHLFGGGEAELVFVESDDPLDAGLEIMCQPPGKKLATLSLLSGGEQTLTALALIFAVFLANPAPICVLDEVDAPLDDANVTRFCDLLDEMTRRTQTRFLVITHHSVTMSRMDRLFGVTMAEQGVSQLVSVDLNLAEQLVA